MMFGKDPVFCFSLYILSQFPQHHVLNKESFLSPWNVSTTSIIYEVPIHSLRKEMATHCSILAWRILRTEEPSGLPSMGLHRVGHDWSDLAAAAAAYITRSVLEHSVLVSLSVLMINHYFCYYGTLKFKEKDCLQRYRQNARDTAGP